MRFPGGLAFLELLSRDFSKHCQHTLNQRKPSVKGYTDASLVLNAHSNVCLHETLDAILEPNSTEGLDK